MKTEVSLGRSIRTSSTLVGVTCKTLEHVEIHGFCDAFGEAYVAVAYLRSTSTGETHISLIMAKMKVAPIRRQSIPRLELCGALILSKILKRLGKILQIPIKDTYTWLLSDLKRKQKKKS